MARTRRPIEKAQDPYTDGSVVVPHLDYAATSWGSLSRDIGSYGLRQFGGWVQEEFLPSLRGRELTRTYREMLDNNPTIGAIVHAITQSMRSVRWREVPPNSSAEAQKMVEFAESLRHDCSHTWEEFISEAMSMIGYGFAPMELVYKRRRGRKVPKDQATSKYNDGLIGFRRMPIRGQDTVLKWFFDPNGQVTGLTQQPWVGRLVDIPIEKLLLFRPTSHKNNPQGRSVLRNCVRPHYFIKRLEEMEAVLFERLSGLPVICAPNQLLQAAQGPTPDKAAVAAVAALSAMVKNVRIGEQMGLVLPSDMWQGPNGPTGHKMYDFQLVTPNSGHVVDPNPLIQRYKLDQLKSVLADFIDLGHQARGTQNLAITKIDMFYKSIEGWLYSVSSVYDRYGKQRVWALNGFDEDLMPELTPDMVSRVDLQQLGAYIVDMTNSGFDLHSSPDVEDYLRHQAGMPELPDEELDISREADNRDHQRPANDPGNDPTETPAQRAAGAVVRTMARSTLRTRKVAPVRNIITRPTPVLPNGHDTAVTA